LRRPARNAASPRLLWALGGAAFGVAVLLVVLVIVLGRKGDDAPPAGNDGPPRGGVTTPRDKEITNKLGMKLVLIKAGKFGMGSPEKEDRRQPDEGPQIDVELSHPFYMSSYEVTVGQFRQFVKATGYVTEAEENQAGATDHVAHTQNPQCTWRTPGFEQ